MLHKVTASKKVKGEEMPSVLDKVATHLKFLGYEVENNKVATVIIATHPTKPDIFIVPTNFGNLYYLGRYEINSLGLKQIGKVLEHINLFNSTSMVLRCFLNDENIIMFEAFYPNLYEKAAFGLFIETISYEITLMAKEDINLIEYTVKAQSFPNIFSDS